ncbi:PfkB family carbohydrate kinase [Streptomyces sannanensis]|uniref:PfkB family carbohydrate kinase n=1 Tax=Streptomyces sannanensis TaxID=285536 RepID=A0ABP6SBX7_9ACTN
MPRSLFVGLCTLDVIQLVEHVPGPNEKVTALAQTIAAGGPAANAAAAFSHLGGRATLLTGIGGHPLAAGITADLGALGVHIIDLNPDAAEPPTVSSILVTDSTGERAVASVNATGIDLEPPQDLEELLEGVDSVEFDGHHMALAIHVAETARNAGVPTVFDGGSWKPGTEKLLPLIDVAVCSADFRPPGASSHEDVLRYLLASGVPRAAVSRGDAPILWTGPEGTGSVAVPQVEVADTLGAGDILHGALTYYLGLPFPEVLARAAEVATLACASFGTRTWMVKAPG